MYEENPCCNQFQLIITDLDMPKKNGYQAISEILNFFR